MSSCRATNAKTDRDAFKSILRPEDIGGLTQ